MRVLVEDLRREWRALDERIAAFDAEFVALARQDAAAKRFTTIPGIGCINAMALAAAVGDARAFGRGRDMAAWLGLTPRQLMTGGKPRLLGISKRGNPLSAQEPGRCCVGRPAVLVNQDTPLGRWTRALLVRAPKNVVIVALADKHRLGGPRPWPRLRGRIRDGMSTR